jgi:hypothetical protein
LTIRQLLIFCDEYAGLTGSRIAYGGCYDRNDNVGEYCDKYHEEEEKNGDGWSCKELCANYDDVVTKGEHCDNSIAAHCRVNPGKKDYCKED